MITMNAFTREPESLIRAELVAVERVLRSGHYVLGPEVKAFEQAFGRTCGVPHVVGVGNGMDAIEIGLRALGIGRGDEVITTPMTAFATTLAILRAGATPVFADIDRETALLDPSSVARCISARTRAIVLVHLYGQVREMDRFRALCDGHGIALVEDCAQAHLASVGGVPAGAFGALGAYSFYPTKNLGAIGDGGAIVTRDAAHAERARRLRNYGQSARYHHPELGMNSRLDELQAAILLERLAYLAEQTARRRAIASMYRGALRNPRIRLMSAPVTDESHVHHLFVVCTEARDQLGAHLASRGIESLSHYPVPVHHQPPCREFPTATDGLRNAEAHARECLSIPCHPHLTDDEVTEVIDALDAFSGV